MKKIIALLIVAILSISLVACNQENKGNDNEKAKGDSQEKLEIKTTVFPFKSFIEQIGGKHVSVESIYPPGTDLHNYEPTQKEIIGVNDADLFVYAGDDLDPVSKKIASTIKKGDKKLSLEKGLDKSKLLTDQHEHGGHDHHHHEGHEHHHHGGYDPHVWLDPEYNKVFIKEIKNDLVKKDPDNKSYYQKNYKKVLSDLNKIDNDLENVTKNEKGNAVFISHESLGYLADRYGFVQKGIQSMNAEDPSQAELTKLTKEIKDTKAKYILYENNINHKMADTVRKETDAKTLKFSNMESLTKKDLSSGKTYQDYMKENVESIDKALSSKVKVKDEKASHKHDKAIQDGYFKENQVKDRELSDYSGNWQSVYPLLLNGDLDKVMKHKAEEDSSKTAKEYKEQYNKSYKTDVENIKITSDTITYKEKDGSSYSGKYVYDGYEILEKDEGKKGIRFIYKLQDGDDKAPKFVQFSDHNISPAKAVHFHIYMGDNRSDLLKENKNFPTFYPSDMTPKEVAEEMMAH